MEEFKPVVFGVAGQKFGIDISLVQGIEKEQRICPVPNTPEHIKGIINLRGIVIPVFDLRKKLNIGGAPCQNPQYIILTINRTYIAIEVDGVEEIHNVQENEMHKVPSIISGGETGYIQNVLSTEKDLIIIIDINKVLTEEELSQVNDFVKNQEK